MKCCFEMAGCKREYVAIVPGQSLGYPYGSFPVCSYHNPFKKPVRRKDGTITMELKKKRKAREKEREANG